MSAWPQCWDHAAKLHKPARKPESVTKRAFSWLMARDLQVNTYLILFYYLPSVAQFKQENQLSTESQFTRSSCACVNRKSFCFVLDLFHFVLQKVQLLMRSFWELNSQLSSCWDVLHVSPVTQNPHPEGWVLLLAAADSVNTLTTPAECNDTGLGSKIFSQAISRQYINA